MDSIKRKSGIIKRIGLIFLVLIVGLVTSAGVYLHLRKNEISEELLQRVNKVFPGEFTVGSIAVGNLLSYPNLEFTLNRLQFWESELGSGQPRRLIIDVPKARFQADLKDILKNSFVIERLELKDPELFIERDSAGLQIISKAFKPYRKNKRSDSTKVFVDILEVEMIGGKVSIIDRPSGVMIPISVEELVGDFQLENNSIKGDVDFRVNGKEIMDTLQIETPDFGMRFNGAYDLDLNQKRLKFNSPRTEIGPNAFDLELVLDYKDQNVLDLDLKSGEQGLALENLLYSDRDSINQGDQLAFRGEVGFISHLTWTPDAEKSFAESIVLDFSIEGDNLNLKGADLDKFIDNFKRSQNFNLVDVSAVMFAGPAGLAISKGGDYASLAFASKGDSTQVGKFLAEWRMRQGTLETRDVALSTMKHRLSVDGIYSFTNDSLRFNFHVLDKKGCELVGQNIRGSSSDYKMGKMNIIKTFMGPVKNFFQNLGMVKCEVVYFGRVQHPETKKEKEKREKKAKKKNSKKLSDE